MPSDRSVSRRTVTIPERPIVSLAVKQYKIGKTDAGVSRKEVNQVCRETKKKEKKR